MIIEKGKKKRPSPQQSIADIQQTRADIYSIAIILSVIVIIISFLVKDEVYFGIPGWYLIGGVVCIWVMVNVRLSELKDDERKERKRLESQVGQVSPFINPSDEQKAVSRTQKMNETSILMDDKPTYVISLLMDVRAKINQKSTPKQHKMILIKCLDAFERENRKIALEKLETLECIIEKNLTPLGNETMVMTEQINNPEYIELTWIKETLPQIIKSLNQIAVIYEWKKQVN